MSKSRRNQPFPYIEMKAERKREKEGNDVNEEKSSRCEPTDSTERAKGAVSLKRTKDVYNRKTERPKRRSTIRQLDWEMPGA